MTDTNNELSDSITEQGNQITELIALNTQYSASISELTDSNTLLTANNEELVAINTQCATTVTELTVTNTLNGDSIADLKLATE